MAREIVRHIGPSFVCPLSWPGNSLNCHCKHVSGRCCRCLFVRAATAPRRCQRIDQSLADATLHNRTGCRSYGDAERDNGRDRGTEQTKVSTCLFGFVGAYFTLYKPRFGAGSTRLFSTSWGQVSADVEQYQSIPTLQGKRRMSSVLQGNRGANGTGKAKVGR